MFMDRCVFHLNISAFPIAVERVRDQSLCRRPVVIASPHSGKACIQAVSYEAYREGIWRGMPVSRALKVCPGLKILPPNNQIYQKASDALNHLLANFTPLWETAKPGHVYLDMTGTTRLFGRAVDSARRVQREVDSSLRLTGSVGVAANKLVSRIAAKVKRPNGICYITAGEEEDFLAPLGIELLPASRQIDSSLTEELNICTIGELALIPLPYLEAAFGHIAHILHAQSLGIDNSPLRFPKAQPEINEDEILKEDENDDERLLAKIYHLTEQAAHRAFRLGLVANRFILLIRHTDFTEVTRSSPVKPQTNIDRDLFKVAKSLFFKTCKRRVTVRYIKVTLTELERTVTQLELPLLAVEVKPKKVQKDLMGAIEKIRKKQGEKVIAWAATKAVPM